ncbi:MAG: hypothetical protein ACRDQ1_00295 [Sciscionella sp.]
MLFASGLAHLGVQVVLGGPWSGPVSWRKAADFGMAFGLTLLAVTWASRVLALRPRVRDVLLLAFGLACAVEVVAITIQAWRGVPSHFNTSTPLNSVFAFSAAGGGAVIIACGLRFAVAAFRRTSRVPTEQRMAVAAGFASLLVALGIGAAMIVIGTRVSRTGGSLGSAYNAAIVLVPAHAAAMQGILLLPALAWLTSFTTWSAAHRIRTTTLACLGYLLGAGAIVIDSIMASIPADVSGASGVATVLTVAGAAGLLLAAYDTLNGLFRSGSRRVKVHAAQPRVHHR